MAEYLYAGCATLILFIILLVIGKKGRGVSDHIFLIWMVILLFNVATFIVVSQYNYPSFFTGKILVEFSEASVFLHGPLFLLYTQSLTVTGSQLQRKDAVHLVPFVGCFLILISTIVIKSEIGSAARLILTIIKMISLLVYTSFVIVFLRKHRRRVEKIFSNAETKYLDWLRFLAWGIISIWIITSAGLLMYNFSILNIPQYGAEVGNLALCGFIFLIGYFGVRQEAIFNFVKKEEPPLIGEKPVVHISPLSDEKSILKVEAGGEEAVITQGLLKDKYKNSGLSEQKSRELFDVLSTFMLEQKPYLDSELTLFSLAKQLNMHANHLSQIINQNRSQNFFDYINEQRVNDVKDVLLSNKFSNHSLLGIAYEFGFNSKASFNRAFKKFTGITPSLFRSNCQLK